MAADFREVTGSADIDIPDESPVRSYPFCMTQVPRMTQTDPRLDQLIASKHPVVIENCDLVSSALCWNLDFLVANLGDGDFTVYESSDHKFMYYDDNKLQAHAQFVPAIKRRSMTFTEFADRVHHQSSDSKRVYMQHPLNDQVSDQIISDFMQFNWSWLKRHQTNNKWGPLTSNLLLVGLPGNVTPCHYDEQENFLAQVQGKKRVILMAPDQYPCLYTFPVHHPHDRQSQVDFDNPDYKRFPRFKDVQACEATIGPGDVLYIPMYWFHNVESLTNTGITTSITFWYKAANNGKITYPLTAQQKMTMMRNVEKMITEVIGSHKEVAPFMQNMVLGRYT